MDKKIQRSEREDAKTMAGRDKYRSKIEAKYDKKISKFERKVAKSEKTNDITKIDRLQTQKDTRLKDFDKGSEYIRTGMKKYNDVLRNYKNVRLSEISNTASGKYAKSEVDRIIKEYKKQQRGDRAYTKLIYATQSAHN